MVHMPSDCCILAASSDSPVPRKEPKHKTLKFNTQVLMFLKLFWSLVDESQAKPPNQVPRPNGILGRAICHGHTYVHTYIHTYICTYIHNVHTRDLSKSIASGDRIGRGPVRHLFSRGSLNTKTLSMSPVYFLSTSMNQGSLHPGECSVPKGSLCIWRSTHMLMYIHMYVHMYVHACGCIHMYICIHIHVHAYTYVHMHMYIHRYICTYIHVCTYINWFVCLHACVSVIHPYIPAYIHTYVHA